jgi:hypothetical protein
MFLELPAYIVTVSFILQYARKMWTTLALTLMGIEEAGQDLYLLLHSSLNVGLALMLRINRVRQGRSRCMRSSMIESCTLSS